MLSVKLMEAESAEQVNLEEARSPAEAIRLEEALPQGVTHASAPRTAFTKRCFDVFLGSFILLATLPLLLVSAIVIKLSSKGPVLFFQKRVGRDGQMFCMYKFRTMVVEAEKQEEELAATVEGSTFFKIKNDHRITGVGHFFRKYSIDELPQLLNVLNGTMSLVGPRPLLQRDFDRFSKVTQDLDLERRYARFSVPPGMTGLWQVSGRSSCSDEERMRLDIEYVDRWGPTLDLSILLRTIPAVVSARGAT